MEAPNSDKSKEKNHNTGLNTFIIKRAVIAVCIIAAVLWALSVAIDNLETNEPIKEKIAEKHSTLLVADEHDGTQTMTEGRTPATLQTHGTGSDQSGRTIETQEPDHSARASETNGHSAFDARTNTQKHAATSKKASGGQAGTTTSGGHKAQKPTDQHRTASMEHGANKTAQAEKVPIGVTFVDAVMAPISYELNDRFWGWRPNDILNFTDNVNNYQLGVLEVTRRSVIMLSERISRTGTTDAFNPNLENAVNWLMVRATRYWFPSPESKFKESLMELSQYKKALNIGVANFYTRADNIIPLLASYEDLLGSCDENLVKEKEKDGSEVGFFGADNYFYYAKGVASTMAQVLEAVAHDFETTLKNRHGEELLHHAIVSCQKAASLEPLVVTNTDLDGILANHRANMAAPISHARFYIGQLIKTLST